MDIATTYSRAQLGVEAPAVQVEVHITGGLPRMTLVGLPEAAVRESRERVRSALLTSRFDFPDGRITVNLAPADLPKAGGRYDLAIAVGILAASGQLPDAAGLDRWEFLAELALDGRLRDARGALPACLSAAAVGRTLVTTPAGAAEGALADPERTRAAHSLREVVAHLTGDRALPLGAAAHPRRRGDDRLDLAEVNGQWQARRALEIAAAGAHNLLLVGPPGTGKTLLARRITTVLPPLSRTRALESAAVASIGTAGFDPGDFGRAPFRAPHHSASAAALVGGGNPPGPGEIALAHNGVLFLDELAEFPRRVLDALRQPLESREVSISRAGIQVTFPAAAQLIAAMNPCPCGLAGDPAGGCRCSPGEVDRYRGRISGPMLDRFDLRVEMPRAPQATTDPPREDSAAVRARVCAARARAQQRQGGTNAELGPAALARHAALDAQADALLQHAGDRFVLSERARARIRRVARTIADLADSAGVDASHLAEALALRATPAP